MHQHNISTKDVMETLQVVTLAVAASIAAETLRWAGILLVAAKGGWGCWDADRRHPTWIMGHF